MTWSPTEPQAPSRNPPPLRTLVAGSIFYEEVSGTKKVPETCWLASRMFSDHLYKPIFGMVRVPAGTTENCSVALPPEVSVLPLNRSTRRPFYQRAFADFNWERTLLAAYIEQVDAVCCIYPDWAAVHLHRMATAKRRLSFACLLGDWAGVYERMALEAPPVRRPLLHRLARHADLALREAAKASRVLFCVGQALADRYGYLAPHTVVCSANTQEEGDIREREDTCRSRPSSSSASPNSIRAKVSKCSLRLWRRSAGRGTPSSFISWAAARCDRRWSRVLGNWDSAPL